MIDILTFDSQDELAVTYLTELLQERFSVAQRRQFLADLDAWNARIPPEARKAMAMFARHQTRGTCTPALVNAYLTTVAKLVTTDEWRRVLSWRERILNIESLADRRAA